MGGLSVVLSVLGAIGSVAVSEDWYKEYPGTTSYNGHGGVEIDSDQSAPKGLSGADCQKRCTMDWHCDCVSHRPSDGKCWKRHACDPSHFGWDQAYNTYMKQRGPHAPAFARAAPAETYCPDPANDFQSEGNWGGSVEWSSSGWTIHGSRRVSSKASFNLAGGYIEWEMDLSGAHGSVNNNLYLTYPSKPNCGIDCYCDSGFGTKQKCAEMDLTENNGNCWQQTTWHTDPSGGDTRGQSHEGPLSPQARFRAEWDASGANLVVHAGNNTYNGSGLQNVMSQVGAVIYSSQWKGWAPGGNKCGQGDLGSSVFAIKNLRIHGSVVQGPPPRKCSSNSTVIV